MSSASTSLHRINADRKLNTLSKVLYLTLNWLNNQLPYTAVDPAMAIEDFRCDISEAQWQTLGQTSSPSRKLSDLFWQALPWVSINKELGPIQFVDCGCGGGNYGPKLLNWCKSGNAQYLGIDATFSNQWQDLTNLDQRLQFLQVDANTVGKHLPEKANLFISQSAIEHFDDDLVFFSTLKNFILKNKRPTVQIHLFPSAACLLLYLLHGVRQYTPRTISQITQLFRPFSYAVLYRLGGKACNRLHYDFITWPLLIKKTVDLRQTRTDEYDQSLRNAIRADMLHPQSSPAFWALVVHSHPTTQLFGKDASSPSAND